MGDQAYFGKEKSLSSIFPSRAVAGGSIAPWIDSSRKSKNDDFLEEYRPDLPFCRAPLTDKEDASWRVLLRSGRIG